MKKNFLLGLLVVLSFVVVGCGQTSKKAENPVENQSQEVQKKPEQSTKKEKDKKSEEGIKVDKKLFDVEITFPVFFTQFGGEELLSTELDEEAKAQGIKKITVNQDGSVTYTLSHEGHTKMMQEMSDSLTEIITELVESEDFVSIQEIKVDKKFKKYQVIVDRELFENSFDRMGLLGLAMTSMFYQIFDGASESEYQTTIEYVDSTTNKVFETAVFPEAWETLGDSLNEAFEGLDFEME